MDQYSIFNLVSFVDHILLCYQVQPGESVHTLPQVPENMIQEGVSSNCVCVCV